MGGRNFELSDTGGVFLVDSFTWCTCKCCPRDQPAAENMGSQYTTGSKKTWRKH